MPGPGADGDRRAQRRRPGRGGGHLPLVVPGRDGLGHGLARRPGGARARPPAPAPGAGFQGAASTAMSIFGPVAVLLPVKSFAEAKLRLAPALDPGRRAALARAMATLVVAAAAPLPTAVVCDDAEVATWARDLGALVVWEPERGLNRDVRAGVARLAGAGAARVVVAHADLPRARAGRLAA